MTHDARSQFLERLLPILVSLEQELDKAGLRLSSHDQQVEIGQALWEGSDGAAEGDFELREEDPPQLGGRAQALLQHLQEVWPHSLGQEALPELARQRQVVECCCLHLATGYRIERASIEGELALQRHARALPVNATPAGVSAHCRRS